MSTKIKCTMKVAPFPYSPSHHHRKHHRWRRHEYVKGLLENREAAMNAAAETWATILYPGCINRGRGVGSLLQSYAERAQGIAPCGGGGRATNRQPFINSSLCRAKSAPTPFGLYGGRRHRRSLTRKRRGRRRSRAKRKKTEKKRHNRSKYNR